MTRKIKVKTLEEKAKDNLIKSAPANQEKTPVDYVIPDENETSVEPETIQRGKISTPTVMDDMEYVKKLMADEVPIDYVDTTKSYEPNLPEPDLFINEMNKEAREAVSSKEDMIKSIKLTKEFLKSFNDKFPNAFNYKDNAKLIEEFDKFLTEKGPAIKNMHNRIDDVLSPHQPQCGSTNGKPIIIKESEYDNVEPVVLEEKILDCLNKFKNLNSMNTEATNTETNNSGYENVNHPNHYNNYDVEVIDMMERIWGPEKTAIFCELNAFKYRMRMGTKPTSPISEDLEKEIWYLNKMKALKNQILKSKL